VNSVSNHVNIQIAVAVITAIGACTVACLQYLSQRKTLRTVEELRAKLDAEKARQTEYFKAYLTLFLDGKTQQLTAFKNVLEHVQLLRDRIRNFLGDPQAYDSRLIDTEVRKHVDDVMRAYSESQIYFDHAIRVIFHSIKNHCLRIASLFNLYGVEVEEKRRISVLQDMRDAESQLADLQSLLRNEAHKASATFLESMKRESGEDALS
jgi:hypothetical protein